MNSKSKKLDTQSSSIAPVCRFFSFLVLQIHVTFSVAALKSEGSNFIQLTEPTFKTHQGFLEDTFIINLINQEKFNKCSLFILQDRFDYSESVENILQNAATTSLSTLKSAYIVKYGSPTSDKFDDGNATILLDNFPIVSFPISISNFRRKSDPCQIVILMINDIRPDLLKQIYNLMSPVFIPITRKDEDFYIFKTDQSEHERLLKMQELPNRIKFKIAVGTKNNAVKVGTICFFCNPGGYPKFIQFPVTVENLAVDDFNYFPDFVWNLNGKLLHVAIPRVLAKIEANPPWDSVANAKRGKWKYLFEKFLMVKFNFTYNMFLSTGKDGKLGAGGTGLELPNGTWIGIIGDLISGKADLGIVTTNTPKRILEVDFTDSFYDIGYLTFVTAQPSRIYSPAALLWPFDEIMWAGIGMSTVFSIILFSTAFKIMKVFNLGCGEDWSIGCQIQFFVSTFLEQDASVHPESAALRSFVALWFLYTMVLTTVYRSKMTALLAFPILSILPKTFEQLTFSDYKVGFIKHGDAAYNTLAGSTDPVYVKLVKEMEIIRGAGLECIEKAVSNKYGCIGYDSAMVHLRERNLSESDNQQLVFAPVTTYNIWLGIATEGKSIYKLNFGKILSWTRPFHLSDVWEKWDMYYNVRLPKLKWWKETGQMDKTKRMADESDNLSMKNIAGAFYILFACLVISFAVLVQEIISFHKVKIYKKIDVRYVAIRTTLLRMMAVIKYFRGQALVPQTISVLPESNESLKLTDFPKYVHPHGTSLTELL